MEGMVRYKDFFLVKVKPGWTDFKIYSSNQLQYLIHGRAEGGAACYTLQLNAGSWQIIGKGDAINWEGIVDEHVFLSDDEGYYTETYFRDYEDVQQIVGSEYNLDEANKSGYSLLRSLGMEPGTTLILKKLKP